MDRNQIFHESPEVCSDYSQVAYCTDHDGTWYIYDHTLGQAFYLALNETDSHFWAADADGHWDGTYTEDEFQAWFYEENEDDLDWG